MEKQTMKKTITVFTSIAGLVLLSLATTTLAKDKEEVTITGEGKCAKCSLKETEKCQNVIEIESKKGGKQKIYLVENDVAKEFHKNICKENKKVTATGTIKNVDGKREMTATKIEVVKE